MWKGRFKEETAQVVQRFTQSLDLDWKLAECDIRGSMAHVKMLVHAGLLTEEEGKGLLSGLGEVLEEVRTGRLEPSIALEDVHMNVEARLTEILGALGARLHMGRSRNDQIATTLRLFLREALGRMGLRLASLQDVLLHNAERHLKEIVPAYTHLQQAQPISMGHYWMSHYWAFDRDIRRLLFALDAMDECPLGAGALAGSTLPLDREFSAAELAFPRPTANSLDTVAQRDYQADYHHFASLFMVHCSRLAEDLIIYSTQEFNWIDLPDAYCTGSSMMPQKKNADVLEIIRGKTGQVVGHMMDLLISLKGLPSTFNRDLQEDKRALWRSMETLEAVLEVLPDLLGRVEVNEKKARRAFKGGMILATDVAEYLVERGVPFRDAHEKVGRTVAWCQDKGRDLDSLTLEEWQTLIPEVAEDLLDRLKPRKAVELRKTLGGTGFSRVREQITRGRELVGQHRSAFQDYRNR